MPSLCFDPRRPIGPLKEGETCTFGPKTVTFDAATSQGYTHGMQLEALAPYPYKHHVFSLKITGLKQEYGWNAVEVLMDKFDGLASCDDMFKKDRSSLQAYGLSISSQFTCPWESTLLTLKVSPSASNIDAYVEQIVDAELRGLCSKYLASSDDKSADEAASDVSNKRKRDESADEAASDKRKRDDSGRCDSGKDDKAMPYLPQGDKEKWTDFGDGLKHRSFDGAFMNYKLPNIGVRMCGCIGNRVEIVPASQRVLDHLLCDMAESALVVYK